MSAMKFGLPQTSIRSQVDSELHAISARAFRGGNFDNSD